MIVQRLEVYIENPCQFLSKKVVLLLFLLARNPIQPSPVVACVMIIQYSKKAFQESARRCGLALRSAARLL